MENECRICGVPVIQFSSRVCNGCMEEMTQTHQQLYMKNRELKRKIKQLTEELDKLKKVTK